MVNLISNNIPSFVCVPVNYWWIYISISISISISINTLKASGGGNHEALLIVLFIGLRGIEGNNLFMRKLTRVNTCETSKHFHFTRILVLDPNGIFSLYFLMFSTFKFLNVTNTTLVKAPNALQWFVLLVLLISLTLKSTIGDSVPPNFVLSPFHLIQC